MSYYSNRPVMKPVVYNEDTKLFVKKLIQHDPNMVGYISNFDLDLLKPVIDQSITYIHRVNLFNAKNMEESVKIAAYSYGKNKAARRFFYDLLNRGIMDLNELEPQVVSILKENITKIICAEPSVLLFSSKEFRDFLSKKIGIDIMQLVKFKSMKYDKSIKKIMDLANASELKRSTWNPDATLFEDKISEYLYKEISGSYWRRSAILNRTIVEQDNKSVNMYGDILENFSDEYGLKERFSSLILFLKLRD
jgi:hypothetical protein